MSLKVLFIGGTGTISAGASAEAAARGIDLTILTRGTTGPRTAPESVRRITASVSDAASLRDAIGGERFDVVVNFISYVPEHARRDIEVFSNRVGQYVYISSASVYEKPPARLPITEATPLRNPFWQYSRDKIASELLLQQAQRDHGFPVTIVRPSHTYDQTRIPVAGGWTTIDRMRRGAPVVVHGDGTSLWTLTHSRDFARPFVSLLGDTRAVGAAFHITSDEVLTWDQITRIMARAAGVEKPQILHVTSDELVRAIPAQEGLHLGDRTYSHIFDNSLIRALVPGFTAETTFDAGAREIIAWHDADPARRIVDPDLDAVYDTLAERAR
ncbi:NAD-dependent epimerase/dehydratase family protein [Microbacterium sp. ET2]|uniref:NAD-dependent epimerase/dehydratase family protein n=1 Tax=Microbacterium albipurpureum TaxID=3050384 RepID=UPI00259D0D52|nr:NAD-dependent epimerase/dehydratase family protein [Microbacterium sp. ET2 (Ac-2212)]WJL96753.1 NAD-dependent epimerase/dehydratase family protein [Microbacterium sp. ET2 (Ac-2212)]